MKITVLRVNHGTSSISMIRFPVGKGSKKAEDTTMTHFHLDPVLAGLPAHSQDLRRLLLAQRESSVGKP